jgi:hypothetical protein
VHDFPELDGASFEGVRESVQPFPIRLILTNR